MHTEFYAVEESVSLKTAASLDGHTGNKDHFLKLMWFQPSGIESAPTTHGHPYQAPRHFKALHQSRLMPNVGYRLPDAVDHRVRAESSASEVMTDLRRNVPITISPTAFIDDANQTMIVNHVRALFVGDDQRLLGIVTASDILGQKPIQLTQQRGIRHDEVLVRDIMTGADLLDVIAMSELRDAKVGDVVETLKLAGRQHALVVDETTGGQQMIVGMFSLTQIARQLGIALNVPDIGRTFAEIEAAIAF
ncbi:MAG: CBS domain-containing protein [Proteobacteria bacterium]|nr:CBS domain-containing protein [Pseudomonadota bacterium]